MKSGHYYDTAEFVKTKIAHMQAVMFSRLPLGSTNYFQHFSIMIHGIFSKVFKLLSYLAVEKFQGVFDTCVSYR